MSNDRLFSFRNPWFTVGAGLTAALAAAAAAAGLIWLPRLEPGARYAGLWDAICSAAGVLGSAPRAGPVVPPGYQTTQVALTPQTLGPVGAEAVGRGATLALRCTMCHGARGLSEANSPNLAGQYSPYLYKQLRDFGSGARPSAVMAPLVSDLSDRDMRDLADYYAYLPRVAGYHPATEPRPAIVVSGAPMRSIAPCGACHGGLATLMGSAWLEGQPYVYLRDQLRGFASGARHNDASEQMRNVARNMSPAEIETAARYYASHP